MKRWSSTTQKMTVGWQSTARCASQTCCVSHAACARTVARADHAAGQVYDVTNFLDEHPGGAEVMMEVAGKVVHPDASADGKTKCYARRKPHRTDSSAGLHALLVVSQSLQVGLLRGKREPFSDFVFALQF
jgi:hypothetical protein